MAASEFALRLIPIILSATAQYLLATLALRLYPDESPWLGFISVLLLQDLIAIVILMALYGFGTGSSGWQSGIFIPVVTGHRRTSTRIRSERFRFR